MTLFRSEIMKLYQLTVPKDDSQTVMNVFGDIGQCHFLDLNHDVSPFSLPYTSSVKACEASER